MVGFRRVGLLSAPSAHISVESVYFLSSLSRFERLCLWIGNLSRSHGERRCDHAACARTCKLCRRTLPAGASGRTKGKTWQCRTCLSLKTMLYRNLGSGTVWTKPPRGSRRCGGSL